ncbi:urocanate hydratase [Pyramidobacter sp. YE332]|uniref:urocanate hydratase n=1 Tax=Pyramidobacter sp. YE332 TaxID=3068894 RepID=UPI00294AC027|nr:urocanate hydratase [Pyramidobacter sp. YE332]WOL39624.1 urocanate hydratase [Pyramidobacter sp. YE332]
MQENLLNSEAMVIKLDEVLPEYPEFAAGIRRAPDRGWTLSQSETELALRNALRYVPEKYHEQLIPEFMEELRTRGRIYAYRFRPAGRIWGRPIDTYEGKCLAGKAFQVMMDNNLDFETALYPYELVTYGETGQVCQNWLQYRLIQKYLRELTDDTTLVLESGHPVGLFASHPGAPRVILTNGLLVGLFDNQKDWHRAMQLGVSNYGQMTAGGWMYIGPQGIVHGTFNTVLNAARLKFGVGIVAEVDYSRIETRHRQGWVGEITDSAEKAFRMAQEALDAKKPLSIAYYGNVVTLLEYAESRHIAIQLLSDQTSCHAAYEGGYCPADLTFEERTKMLHEDPEEFRRHVDASLRRHFDVIKKLVDRGSYFFDYGNSFMRAVFDAGVTEIAKNGKDTYEGFIWPSYVEDIMGPHLFDYGYGPFRWCCLSGKHEDLRATDEAAMACIDPDRRSQDYDNWVWIRDAEKNNLVVGTQCRILYQDAEGRTNIALAFNKLVREGKIGPVMLGRDHHDVSGTDGPFRETANVKDGSNICADMATNTFAGNAARGMTLCTLHNGGGVGIGKCINGGFGLLLDGRPETDAIIRSAMMWDVLGGVARRAWARCEHAEEVSREVNAKYPGKYHITLPYHVDGDSVRRAAEAACAQREHHEA